MLITSTWSVDILLLLVTLTFLTYKYVTRKFDYWKNKGVYYIKPIPFVGGAYEIFTFKKTAGLWLKKMYDSVKEPFFGIFIFDQPHLVLRSPELIKRVLIKDFSYFTDRTILAPKHDIITSNMLFMQKNPGWRKMRPKMTPIFTSGKLKGMFELINNVGSNMNKYIRKNLGQQLESKEIIGKYSTDVIAICAFAIKANSFENEDADFRRIARLMFDSRLKTGITQTGFFFLHSLVNLCRLHFFDGWVHKYLSSIFWQAIRMREESNTKGNDLIDMIVNLRKDKELCKEIDFEGEKVVAQAVQFFAAGFETTSSTAAFTLYELCIRPELQDRLRDEIVSNIKKNNGITYEGVQSMKYLEMCITETLRKYPILPFLDRRCNADYTIPGTNVVIEKGMPVYIPMLGLHYDEKFFPEPDKYDPERFVDKYSCNADGLKYIPFGEGPRSCIGGRFALLGIKLALVNILSEFSVERSRDTPVPMEFEPRCFLLVSKAGLPMEFKKLAKAI